MKLYLPVITALLVSSLSAVSAETNRAAPVIAYKIPDIKLPHVEAESIGRGELIYPTGCGEIEAIA